MSVINKVKDTADVALAVTDIEVAVIKATSRVLCIPKAKHVRRLIQSTFSKEISIGEIFRAIGSRLSHHDWIIALKALVLVHILMKEGCTDRILGFLAGQYNFLNMTGFKDKNSAQGIEQTRHIKSYASYLEEKIIVFREIKIDYTSDNVAIKEDIKKLETAKLLLQSKCILRQTQILLDCNFYLDQIDNPITLHAFRYLIKDLFRLFLALNEAVICILDRYFEMSKVDASTSISIYKEFSELTSKVTVFFQSAKKMETELGLSIPSLVHAPTSLIETLQDYLAHYDENKQSESKREKIEIPTRKEIDLLGFDQFDSFQSSKPNNTGNQFNPFDDNQSRQQISQNVFHQQQQKTYQNNNPFDSQPSTSNRRSENYPINPFDSPDSYQKQKGNVETKRNPFDSNNASLFYNESNNQPINQPVNQPVHQPVNPFDPPDSYQKQKGNVETKRNPFDSNNASLIYNESNNQPVNQPVYQPVHQPVNPFDQKYTNQPQEVNSARVNNYSQLENFNNANYGFGVDNNNGLNNPVSLAHQRNSTVGQQVNHFGEQVVFSANRPQESYMNQYSSNANQSGISQMNPNTNQFGYNQRTTGFENSSTMQNYTSGTAGMGFYNQTNKPNEIFQQSNVTKVGGVTGFGGFNGGTNQNSGTFFQSNPNQASQASYNFGQTNQSSYNPNQAGYNSSQPSYNSTIPSQTSYNSSFMQPQYNQRTDQRIYNETQKKNEFNEQAANDPFKNLISMNSYGNK